MTDLCDNSDDLYQSRIKSALSISIYKIIFDKIIYIFVFKFIVAKVRSVGKNPIADPAVYLLSQWLS